MCGFIAQLVKYRTGIFQFKELARRSLKKSGLHFHLQPQFKYELFHVYFTSFHSSREI